MIGTGIEKRIQVQQIIESQLPEFILSESPKTVDFLKQYYISQEHRGGVVDIGDNLDQYIKLDNLTPEVVVGVTTLTSGITSTSDTITVSTTKGFPNEYGLLKVDEEIITYTGITTNTFTGCVRGFSGITSYRDSNNPGELVFATSTAGIHTTGVTVNNLSVLFLQEFYKKLKSSLTPGLENSSFVSNLDVSNFIKESKSLYQSKGTAESFRILFNVLFGVTPKVVDLEEFLVKPSSAEYIRREVILAEVISGDPNKLIGQTITKSTDPETKASISEVEVVTRNRKTYYKIGLFVGFNDRTGIQGTFTIPGKTKVIGNVSVGSSVITVDSTVGFGTTGTVISGINTITYTDRTINQFLNCTGVSTAISTTDDLRSDENVFGYEDGDLTKKVELRITGVLSDFELLPTQGSSVTSEGERIAVKNVGEVVPNPISGKTKKEVWFNSWIYNTSCSFDIDKISGSTFTLKSDFDKSNLKEGDIVQIIRKGTNIVDVDNATIQTITVTSTSNQLFLNGIGGFTPTTGINYFLRRKLKLATSSTSELQFGNDVITSNVQNTYNLNDTDFYVASSSMPAYDITETVDKSTISQANGTRLQGFSNVTQKYSIISFPSDVPFITGDAVFYKPETTRISELTEDVYYVKVLSDKKQIKLYSSRSFIVIDDNLEFTALPDGSGKQTFVLLRHKNEQIGVQKILKKFPVEPNIKSGKSTKTNPGATGILVNGVEIINYKSDDKIFSGPLSSVKLLNGGSNFDVINLPKIVIPPVGSGTTALVQPVVSGSLKEVLVDQQNFDIEKVLSITLTGGGGSGAILRPIVTKRVREISFDARQSTIGGGVDINHDRIIINGAHNLLSGEPLVYDNNENLPLGVSTIVAGIHTSNNADQNRFLSNGSVYYPEVIGISSIRLFESFSDYNAGVNTVGFTTVNTQGTHKFKLLNEKNHLRSVVVENPGSDYINRKLIVKPSAISTIENTITFANHGFVSGDTIEYNFVGGGSIISGLSTSSQYKVIKLDNNSFRLASTLNNDYERNDYVKFTSTGTGLQEFAFPPIILTVNAVYSPVSIALTESLVVTPIVRGSIVDNYLYEGGTNYGSDILNFEKKPSVRIQNGKEAEINVVTSNGKIIATDVRFGGSEYFSPPDLEVVGIGSGIGGRLRPVVENGKITDVKIVNAGIGYTTSPQIIVKPAGVGEIFDPAVRSLTLNNLERFEDEILLQESLTNLQYAVVGYNTSIYGAELGDTGGGHSPIIGWAYDGNPIYGPYGFTDPKDSNSSIKLLDTSFTLDTSNIVNRPSSFSSGFFVEDYKFTDDGDLDSSNGRFTKTPDYPDGVYAYFVGVTTGIQGNLIPKYPYFIGDTYRSEPIEDNFLINQSTFDFNGNNLIRNTLPYKVSDDFADNDFLIESNEIVEQQSIVESVTRGQVQDFQIVEAGSDYKVNDTLNFDNLNSSGGGASARVSHVEGKTISSVNTSVETYTNVVYVRKNATQVSAFISTSHTLSNNDTIAVSGLSTSVPRLTDSHKIGVSSERVVLYKELGANATAGVVTDIYVSKIPDVVSAGSSIGIGTESLLVLNTFNERGILRVKRGVVGAAHTLSTPVFTVPDSFDIDIVTSPFESKVNDIVFFNPEEQVGVGTTAGVAIGLAKSFTTGERSKVISVPSKSIFIPNHPFTNNQEVIFKKPTSANAISCGTGTTTSVAASFNLPLTGDSQTVFIKNISKDLIGISTTRGGDTIFFKNDGTDSFEYSIESNFTQVLGKAQKITAHVAVSTSHNLANGNTIDLTLDSNISGGTGVSTSVIVKYSAAEDKILINTVPLAQTNIGNDSIFLADHGYKTGQKVFYDGKTTTATGLSTGTYFVYRLDDNTFQLAETKYDVDNEPPKVVGITTNTGGSSQELSLINPPLSIIKNNDLVFYVSDSSLSGYNFNLYYDSDFNNEFVSTGSTSSFVVLKEGSVGVGTTSKITLKYSDSNPTNLFYAIEKSGFISTSDPDVNNGSKLTYIDSDYEGSFSVFGVGTTSFNLSLNKIPERLSYTSSQTDKLSYITNSPLASGGVGKILLTSAGLGYKNIPGISSITSVNGINAKILCLSDNINKINQVRILDPGFEYHSDKTLRPDARISPTITLINSDVIGKIEVVSGGKNYISAPDLVVVDPETGLLTDQGVIELELSSSSISEVNVISSPKGLKPIEQRIRTINNSNGISISQVVGMSTTSTVGVVTCTLVTPVAGFTTSVFEVGEQIFVEGIQLESSTGSGYNSTDHGFNFFTVTSYTNTNPAVVKFDLTGITTSPIGIAKTTQSNYATITKFSDYPSFRTIQASAQFKAGERLAVKIGNNFVITDLTVFENNPNEFIRISGKFELNIGNQIRGEITGTVATINSIDVNRGRFNIDFSLKQNRGWDTETGKLSEDYQVLADNDYYQNLSYTIQSPIPYTDLIDPVNRLLHTTGLKNFSDTGITSTAVSGISSISNLVLSRDLITEQRVDTINNFDLVIDTDTLDSGAKSKFLKFKNKKLASYIECRTNRVIEIDDISSQFSNAESTNNNRIDIPLTEDYTSYIVQTKNISTNEVRLDEVVVFKDSTDTFTFEKNSLGIGTDRIVEIVGFTESTTGDTTLRITPNDPFNDDLDIKVYENRFNSTLSGVGTQAVGFINLIGVSTNVGAAVTTSVLSAPVGFTSAFYATVEVKDTVTSEKNLVDIYVTQDGTDSYFTEYYVDSGDIANFSSNFIGTFTSNLQSNILSLDFNNTGINTVNVRAKAVGFGTTTAGTGTYRFKDATQLAGSERSVNLQSNYKRVSALSTIVGVDSNKYNAIKSIVKVSKGTTHAMHQVIAMHDGTSTSTVHYPFISIGSTAGIGTFIASFSGSNFNLRFNPDSGFSDVEVQAYSELFYEDIDIFNVPPDLIYGRVSESVKVRQYNAVNGDRANKKEFELKHDGVPIFSKQFRPTDTSTLNPVTGVFTITDHFFRTGEKLKYTPKSSFIGVAATAMTTAHNSNVPTDVFAIRLTKDTFKLASSKSNANAGTGVTFVSLGSGNIHQLEMTKKLEKTVIDIDGLIQSPIAFTPVNTTVTNNVGGNISSTSTVFSVAGISSIIEGDILEVGTELMKVSSVGVGTTSVGPISGSGAINLVGVERGSLGSTAATHSDSDAIRKFTGSFNIVDSKIFFTDAPKGTNNVERNQSNLEFPRSEFNGRVYLRNDYSNNRIFDDISDGFTGIGATHRMLVAGVNTTGIQTGSSIVLLNGIFQKPTTANNSGNNYGFVAPSASATNIVFTGITSANGSKIVSQSDINLNQLPRGGVIVSLGSTGGQGIAPLVGAAVTVVKNDAGQITGVGIGTTDVHGSGYRGTVAIGITDHAYEHRFESAGIGSIKTQAGAANIFNGTARTATNAVYTSHTGFLEITIANHGLSVGNHVGIDTGGIVFRCSKDNFASLHPYPRSGVTPSSSTGDPIVGIATDIRSVTTNTFTIFVGQGGGGGNGASINATVGVGGTLIFSVAGAGVSYTNPRLNIPQPSYEALDVIGVSRLGVGATTDTGQGLKVTVDVGASSTTGIGSTMFTVSQFKIARPGFGFKKGDVIKPVGLVTARGAVLTDFTLTVDEIFTDEFASWDFGEFDYTDSIKGLQDGVRTRFPIRLNGQLLSFEIDRNTADSSLIEMQNLLLIFVNGVIQHPGRDYTFEGGTTFNFTSAPDADDDIAVFFYKGTSGVDTIVVDVTETLKKGDVVQVTSNNSIPNTFAQKSRTVVGITTSDTFETEIYTNVGIDEVNFKPIKWTKQKIDKVIGSDIISKSRDSIEPLIYPTARLIGNLSTGTAEGTSIFVDNAEFFDYEEDTSAADATITNIAINDIGVLVVDDKSPVTAKLSATVNGSGQVAVSVVDGGSGYVGSTTSISIAPPVGVAATQFAVAGVSTFAVGTANITNGSIASVTMNNVGFGYTSTNPPIVLAPTPEVIKENITNIQTVAGFSGIVTGISTEVIGVSTLGLRIGLKKSSGNFTGLNAGFPIYIFDTHVGTGLTSLNTSGNPNDVVGIGTTFADNVYVIQSISASGTTAEILVNIHSNTNHSGLGVTVGINSGNNGRFSWGRLFNASGQGSFNRPNPIAIGVTGNTVGLTNGVGISTFPTVQRRVFGIRDTGALRKNLG